MKIYLTCFKGGMSPNDVMGYALAEDGTALASHLCSHKGYAMSDMGWTSKAKHDIYTKFYPDGFELEWVDEPENHSGWLAAIKLNKAKSKAATKADLTKGSHFKVSITMEEK